MKKITNESLGAIHTGSLKENKKKNIKGITLVALVITIIVLLILAGISIASLMGNGLFEKAKLAKEKANEAQMLEDERLSDYENEIDKIVGSRDGLTETEIKALIKTEVASQISGSGFSKEELWSGEKTDTGTINLSKSVNEFDAVYVWGQYYNNSYYGQAIGTWIFKEDFNTDYDAVNFRFILNEGMYDVNRRIGFDFIGENKNQLTIVTIERMRLLKVYGINF